MIVTDRSFRVVYANSAVTQILGWSPPELLGQPVSVLVPDRLQDLHRAGIARFFETGVPHVLGQAIRVPAVAADGREQPVELMLSSVTLGQEQMVMATLRDVADRVDLERDTALTRHLLAAVTETAGVDDLVERLISSLGDELQMSAAAIWVPDESGLYLTCAAEWSATPVVHPLKKVNSAMRLRRGEGIPGRVWASGAPVWVGDVERDGAMPRAAAALESGLRSAFAFAVRADDEVMGVIELFDTVVREPDTGLLKTVDGLGRQVAEIWQRRLIVHRMARVAERERAVATALQEALLPPALAPIPGVDSAVRFRPGGDMVIGGDVYDVFSINPEDADGLSTWGLVVGDVCGHGPEAAAIAAKVRYSIRALSRTGRTLSETLSYLNHALVERDDQRFCTCVTAVIKPDGQVVNVSMCNAGHPPVILRRADGAVEILDDHGPLLGVIVDTGDFPSQHLVLRGGDLVVFTTDGVTEARIGRDMFGEERLVDLVASSAAGTADELADEILAAVLAFAGDAIRDDIVVLVVRAAAC